MEGNLKTYYHPHSQLAHMAVEDERTIETLLAARYVMFINYVARIDPSPQAYIAERSNDLVRFLKTFG